jgi:hypothetical protein
MNGLTHWNKDILKDVQLLWTPETMVFNVSCPLLIDVPILLLLACG